MGPLKSQLLFGTGSSMGALSHALRGFYEMTDIIIVLDEVHLLEISDGRKNGRKNAAVGVIRGLGEVVTCIYGPAVTYAFPDPLVAAYRNSVVHVGLISVLDGTALNWCRQEVLRARMINAVLFGKVKYPELVVFNFRGQLQCRMAGKREGPIETYPKFWNLNPLTTDGQEILRIPASKKSFELVKREQETTFEKEILPATVPEFPTVRIMTLGMNGPLVVPSLFARATVEKQQREFTDGWDPLFIWNLIQTTFYYL